MLTSSDDKMGTCSGALEPQGTEAELKREILRALKVAPVFTPNPVVLIHLILVFCFVDIGFISSLFNVPQM